MRRRAVLTALFMIMISGCASMRKITVESAGAASYQIDVRNTRASSIVVSYTLDSTPRELGTVAAGRTERFIVTSTTGAVMLTFRTQAGTELPARNVSLSGSGATVVTVR